jgi:hypothetical protein
MTRSVEDIITAMGQAPLSDAERIAMDLGDCLMAPGDIEFAYQHAHDWACPSPQHEETATAYARWYVLRYVPHARDLGDLPSHPDAWLRFQDHRYGPL